MDNGRMEKNGKCVKSDQQMTKCISRFKVSVAKESPYIDVHLICLFFKLKRPYKFTYISHTVNVPIRWRLKWHFWLSNQPDDLAKTKTFKSPQSCPFTGTVNRVFAIALKWHTPKKQRGIFVFVQCKWSMLFKWKKVSLCIQICT